MAKEMVGRKCSHCGHNGHNSRTCSRVVKLFGVRLLNPSDHGGIHIRKSVSTGNLLLYPTIQSEPRAEYGYLSDGLVHTCSKSRDRKKGVPWTEQEHRMFLVGLEKLGKGDWRGISRNFVPSRSPTQVASHAQKYFLRQSSLHKRKRRSSLFDICPCITKPYTEENSPDFQPNLSTSAFSVGADSNYSCASMATTRPQLLLPLLPGLELQSQTCSSNLAGVEPMAEGEEHSENLSLSIAPPSGDASPQSASSHLSHCENNVGFREFSGSTMIRVV